LGDGSAGGRSDTRGGGAVGEGGREPGGQFGGAVKVAGLSVALLVLVEEREDVGELLLWIR
jgi:hypothetical protein